MIMYGTGRYIPPDCYVENFTSYMEGYPILDLIPPNDLGNGTEMDFDMHYMSWLLGVPTAYITMMNQLVIPEMTGANVYIIVGEDDWAKMLCESLLKFLQTRYGIQAINVNDESDLEAYEDRGFNPEYGIANFDADMEAYRNIMEWQNG